MAEADVEVLVFVLVEEIFVDVLVERTELTVVVVVADMDAGLEEVVLNVEDPEVVTVPGTHWSDGK